ncbi:hypothetical protein MMC13_006722 [Lambiella insularis]|nr:hypothetical protein [Lambiella insularis]
MSSMQLRRRVFPPKRYEPDLSDGERYMPSLRKPIFHPPFLPFNPNLPPAKFPTLDVPRPASSDTHLNSDDGTHQNAQEMSSVQPQSPGLSGDVARMASPTADSLPFSADHDRRNALHWPEVVNSEQALDSPAFDTIMREMETSDEDNRRPPNQSRSLWRKLASIHQLGITCGLLEQGASQEEVMQLLKLSPEHWQAMSAMDDRRLLLERREETRIAKMQEDLHWFLLDGNGSGPTTLNSSTYDRLLTLHLGRFINGDKPDFCTTTKADLQQAHAFLNSRGLPLSLAGEWKEPYIGTPSVEAESDSNARAAVGREKDSGGANEISIRPVSQAPVANGTSRDRPPNRGGRSSALVRRKFMLLNNDTPSGLPRSDLADRQRKILAPKQAEPALGVTTPQVGQADAIPAPAKEQHLPWPPLESKHILPSNAPPMPDENHAAVSSRLLPLLPRSHPNGNQGLGSPSTIVVQPKKAWSGTAVAVRPIIPATSQKLPTSTTQIAQMEAGSISKPLPSNNVARYSWEALERQRAESMKYSGRTAPQFKEHSTPQTPSNASSAPNASSIRNFKQLAVVTSSAPNTVPELNRDPMRSSITSSTASRGRSGASSVTSIRKDADTPVTPLNDLPGSRSSTRSPTATRLPSRYRNEIVQPESPTLSRKGMKSLDKEAAQATSKALKALNNLANKDGSGSAKSPVAARGINHVRQQKKRAVPQQSSSSTASIPPKATGNSAGSESVISAASVVASKMGTERSISKEELRRKPTRALSSEGTPAQGQQENVVQKRAKVAVSKGGTKDGKLVA